MLERQYCASAYTIDFEHKKILLVYNEKIQKWLQLGGHIEEVETPMETAIRETYEETGIQIKIIGPTFNQLHYQPIAVEHYINKVGDMIDIQYLAIPMNREISSLENKKVIWLPIDELENTKEVEEDIKIKVLNNYQKYQFNFNNNDERL